MSGEAQEAVQLLTIPFDWHLAEDAANELALLCVPHGKNMQVEVLSVGTTIRVASAGAVVDLEWRDALRTEENDLSGTMTAFTTSNVATNRTFDANGATLATSADVLGTLIADLKDTNKPLPRYTITNLTRALTHNSDANTLGLMADQLGQLITDIQEGRITKVTFSNTATDRAYDADSTTTLELSDVMQNLHDDLTPTADLTASASLITGALEGYVSVWEGSLLLNQGDA
ncbi:hypothetical protein LCGC14_3024770, partial [marine sediment metagenome]